MLTTKISINQLEILTEYFDNYCLFMFNKTYNMTDNNLKEYFRDVFVYAIGEDILKETGNSHNIIDEKEFTVYAYYCIREKRIYHMNALFDFDKFLKSNLNIC